MTDPRTMAYINLFAVLGTLPYLCETDAEARELAKIGGKELYLKLREKGILVRHFDAPRISEYNRITVGTDAEAEALLLACREILK